MLAKGENIALLGPNGAGKSTFVKLITREVMPLYREQPPVKFNGNPRATLVDVRKTLGIVSSTMQAQINVHLPAVDIVEGGLFGTLGLPRHVHPDERTHTKALEAMEMLGVAKLADQDIMTMSSGQARRVLFFAPSCTIRARCCLTSRARAWTRKACTMCARACATLQRRARVSC